MARADVIVVGLGAMGSAACRSLAARGVSVLGIDRFSPPHDLGSTHGDTRITRLAIGEGREYVPLARRSHELWRELERETGAELLTQAGVLILGPPSSRFLRETRLAAREYGIEHEDLTGAQVAARYPMLALGSRSETESEGEGEAETETETETETVAYFEPGAGFLRPEAAVAAQLGLARRDGAQLRLGERVLRWSASADGVTVTTDAATHHGDQLVLCAGAWIPELVPETRALLAVHRQLLYWFEIRHGYPRLRDMPAFIWDLGGDRDGFVHLDGFYGLPAVDGLRGGVKIGVETYERTTTPDGRQHPPTAAETEHIRKHVVAPHLPWLGPVPVRTASCLYTCARDCRFLIDRHPVHELVLIVSACSGHGFKHSPAIGEAVAQWLAGDDVQVDLSPFGFARHVVAQG